MSDVETLLRRLALNDDVSVQRVLAGDAGFEAAAALGPKVQWLVRLGALIAVGATTASLRTAAQHAFDAGATDAEIAAVLTSVAPVVGLSQLVSSAPKLASAIGLNLTADE